MSRTMASPIYREEPVVITGLGAFSCVGPSVEALWQAVLTGNSTAQWRETKEDADLHCPVYAAPDPELPAVQLKRLRRMDRCVQFAGAAAWEAWNDAGLYRVPLQSERVAVFAGTSRGPIGTIWESHTAFLAGERVQPSVAPNSTMNCLSGSLTTVFGARGPSLTISGACSSGGAALILAAQQIRSGSTDVALAGGAEAPLHDLLLAQLQAARVVASHPDPRLACRPFDRERNGAVLGEGAGFLVLESLSHARQRGARIYAELGGWAMGSDGGERTGISGDSECLLRNMSEALTMAQISADELDYVNAHGTGTDLNDRKEAHAIAKLAGANSRLATSSTKAVTGHCMGATAALEAVICVRALETNCRPPSANCFEQGSDCPAKLILGEARCEPLTAALSNSAGFWGNNASLVFKQPPA